MDSRWSIQLLGGFSASSGQLCHTRFRTQKTAALLARLAFSLGRWQPREELIDWLWPDLSLVKGRHNLSMALSALRQQLEPLGWAAGSVIVADRLNVWLEPSAVDVDAVRFDAIMDRVDRGMDAERLAEAVALYRGSLLPGFEDEWIGPERNRLHERFLYAAEQQAERLEVHQRADAMAELARRVVAIEPLSEPFHIRLMHHHLAQGDPLAAWRQFHLLQAALDEALGIEPSPESRDLAREAQAQLKAAGQDLVALRRSLSAGSATHRVAEDAAAPYADVDLSAPSVLYPPQEPSADDVVAPSYYGHLPLQLTRFFGRQAELHALRGLVLDPSVRLISLTGVGGTGKTRLAVACAMDVWADLSERIWFVALSDCVEANLIPDFILDALPLERSANRDPFDQIVAELSRHPTLLILDNFEQLVDGGLPIVTRLLQHTPGLTCMLTSRVRLRAPLERELPVDPLPTPAPDWSLAAVEACDSIRLFVDRAHLVRPEFDLTPHNAESLSTLCRRLDGLPLAIELAAARSAVLTPKQIIDRFDQSLDLLANRLHLVDTRHHTLRAAIDWSYRLLSPDIQHFFAQLAVFRGGWTLEAAERACDTPLAVDHLAHLTDCSLVVAEEVADEMRFRLLETVRQFADGALPEADRKGLRARHAAFYVEMAERAAPELMGPQQGEWLKKLDRELDNVRAVMDYCLADLGGRCEMGLRLGVALCGYWLRGGGFDVAREFVEHLLSEETSCSEFLGLRAEAYRQLGVQSYRRRDYDVARNYLNQSLGLLELQNEGLSYCVVLEDLAFVAEKQGDYVSSDVFMKQAIQGAREAHRQKTPGAPHFLAAMLGNYGLLQLNNGALVDAEVTLADSLQLHRSVGNHSGGAHALENLGLLSLYREDLGLADEQFLAALELNELAGDNAGRATCWRLLAEVKTKSGDVAVAAQFLHQSIDLQLEIGETYLLNDTMEAVGALLIQAKRFQLATELFSMVSAWRTENGCPLEPLYVDEYEGRISKLREALGEQAFGVAWRSGVGLELQDAINQANRQLQSLINGVS